MFLTETWLYENSTVTIGELTPPGYSFLNFPRGTRGGGIGVLFKSHHLKLKHKTLQEYSSFEHAIISNSSRTLNVVVVYRPDPSGVNTAVFMNEFEGFLGDVDLLCGRTLMLGDFNLHYDLPSKYEVIQFEAILLSMGYRQLVNVPTHRFRHTLDLLIVKDDDELVEKWDVNPFFFSDHLIINCLLDITAAAASKTFRSSRSFKNINHLAFAADLTLEVEKALMCDHLCVDDLVNIYNRSCQAVLDAHAPVKIKSRSVRYKPKWYGDSVVEARRVRRRCERRWRKTRTDVDYQKYVDAKRAAVDTITLEKSRYYADKFADCNVKDMYRTVNELLNVNGISLPDGDSSIDLATSFCEHFVGKVIKIRREIDENVSNSDLTLCHNYHSNPQSNLSNFHTVNEDDLCEVIMKCPSKSCPLDPMPTWLVKQHLPILLPILTSIVNTSLSCGVFPTGLRRAIITPILKKASLDNNQLGNYRPVSNLPFVGKLIEKVVSAQVSNYIIINGLYDPYQSAYRQARSTETALTCVQNDILRAIDDQRAVFLLMLDLSAAFDTVDHGILLERLAGDFGLTGKVHNWYKTYLENRTCTVNINGDFSGDKDLIYGVPQGSVIGPQAFTYYTRRVGEIISKHDLKYHIYADDVQIYAIFDPNCHGDAACALFRLGQCVKDLQSWMLENRLKLNQAKTEFFVASSPHHYSSLHHLTLNLGGHDIPASPYIRNLGVIFDHSITMAKHITNLSRSINWQLRNLNRIRKHLDTETSHNIVRTLILSRLDYCNSLMYGIDKKHLNRLQVLQNKAARLILKQPSRTHATPLLRSLHWLPISQRIQFKVLLQSFKAWHFNSPDYLSLHFHPRTHKTKYRLRSDSAITFEVPRSRKHAGERAFSIAGPRLWNGLPMDIRGLVSLSVFKRHLKSHLFPSS
jgi:hypothetical protein